MVTNFVGGDPINNPELKPAIASCVEPHARIFAGSMPAHERNRLPILGFFS
jgi:hypothetical protein